MKIIPFAFPAEWDYMELIPLADIHIGDPKTDIPNFRRFVKSVMDNQRCRIICIGDLINNAIKTSVSNVYNETIPPNEQRKFIAEELRPIADRILCFVAGNHEYRSKRDVDMDATEWIADKLGCLNYSEDEMAIKISLGKDAEHGRPVTYGIYMTHGSGGGKRPGGAINNLELLSLSVVNADIVIMGHVHKELGYRFSVREMDLRNNLVRQVEKLCVVAAAWQEFGGYAARKMMIPGAKTASPIILSGKEKKARYMV